MRYLFFIFALGFLEPAIAKEDNSANTFTSPRVKYNSLQEYKESINKTSKIFIASQQYNIHKYQNTQSADMKRSFEISITRADISNKCVQKANTWDDVDQCILNARNIK